MSADIFTTATQLSILLAGRAPVWSELATGTLTPPTAANSGVYLVGAVRLLVHVAMRLRAHHRTTRLTVTTTDLTATYTLNIDGNSVAYDAAADSAASAEDVIVGLQAAIAANGTIAAIVTASALDTGGSPGLDTVELRGVGEADYAIAFTATGTAVVAAVADPTAAELRMWWAMGARVESVAPVPWVWEGDVLTLDRRGRVLRRDCAGMDRLHVQLSARRGHAGDGSTVTLFTPAISIGPCLSEVS